MTRIAYRLPEQMSGQARQLTLDRGNLNVYRALANAANVFTGWMVAGRAALTSPVVPARLRELVILRTGFLMGCPYEIAQHTAVARGIGVSDGEIAAVLSELGPAACDFGELERVVLHLTTELLTTRGVAAPLFDEAHRALGSEGTIEVLMLINRWAGLALVLNALDVDIDESARIVVPAVTEF